VEQAQRAIQEADVVLFLVDGRGGLLPDDEEIARQLRRQGKSVILVVNKVEAGFQEPGEFARLGFDSSFAISAEHGQGIGDLLDAALKDLPRAVPEEGAPPPLRLALVGRPNVGKSSLLNRLVGTERAVVSEVPGTTRDTVDSPFERDGRRYLLVDTAGIRRVRLLRENVDHVSVVQARRAIERADVGVVVLDAESGLREMDATIAGRAVEAGLGLVLAVNKWDTARGRGLTTRSFERDIRDNLKFAPWAPVVFVSATRGRGLDRLLATVDRVAESRSFRVTTGELNRLLARAADAHPPKPDRGSRSVRILYGSQIGTAPPTFALSLNQPVGLHFSYKRYLENRIRAAFGFSGTPLRLKTRHRKH
jgi:GTP-binding protein